MIKHFEFLNWTDIFDHFGYKEWLSMNEDGVLPLQLYLQQELELQNKDTETLVKLNFYLLREFLKRATRYDSLAKKPLNINCNTKKRKAYSGVQPIINPFSTPISLLVSDKEDEKTKPDEVDAVHLDFLYRSVHLQLQMEALQIGRGVQKESS